MTLRKVARDGAISGVDGVAAGPAESGPGGAVGVLACAAGGQRAAHGDDRGAGHRVGGASGKSELGLNGPIPTRLDAAVKAALLRLIEDAVRGGVAAVEGLRVARVGPGPGVAVEAPPRRRPPRRRAAGRPSRSWAARLGGGRDLGARSTNGARVDFSHRKLGAPRLLPRPGLRVTVERGPGPGLPRPDTCWARLVRLRAVKKPWPDWVSWRPNQLWCWDANHFMACRNLLQSSTGSSMSCPASGSPPCSPWRPPPRRSRCCS